jgi:solute carrier family 35, member F1/2
VIVLVWPTAVMVLSYFAFRARYRLAHIAGAGLCISGLAVLLLSDRSEPGSGSNPLLGDALVLIGAALYAIGNVMQESLLGEHPCAIVG